MKVTFLGTAAAEGVPAVFCNCPTCKRARKAGGREIRTRSQILIDADTLFDFPMDTYMHMLSNGLDLSAVKRVLVTHSHMDHFYPQEFVLRGAPYAHAMTEPEVSIFCSETVCDLFAEETAREMNVEIANTVRLNIMRPYDEITDGDMRIIALPAVHIRGEDCLFYYVERGGKGALLVNDTGALDIEVYRRLADMNVDIGLVAFDCTHGYSSAGKGRHMGLFDNAEQLELMDKVGLLRPNTLKYATHFSHNSALLHEELEQKAAEFGMLVAYDGLVVNLDGELIA